MRSWRSIGTSNGHVEAGRASRGQFRLGIPEALSHRRLLRPAWRRRSFPACSSATCRTHKEAKQLLGLDRFEGRTFRGWQKHVAIVLLAYAFLATLRADARDGEDLPPLRQVAKTLVTEATA